VVKAHLFHVRDEIPVPRQIDRITQRPDRLPTAFRLPRPWAGLWLLVGRASGSRKQQPLPQYTLTPDHTAQLFDEFLGHRQAVPCRELATGWGWCEPHPPLEQPGPDRPGSVPGHRPGPHTTPQPPSPRTRTRICFPGCEYLIAFRHEIVEHGPRQQPGQSTPSECRCRFSTTMRIVFRVATCWK